MSSENQMEILNNTPLIMREANTQINSEGNSREDCKTNTSGHDTLIEVNNNLLDKTAGLHLCMAI